MLYNLFLLHHKLEYNSQDTFRMFLVYHLHLIFQNIVYKINLLNILKLFPYSFKIIIKKINIILYELNYKLKIIKLGEVY